MSSHDFHNSIIRNCIGKTSFGPLVKNVRDARALVENAVVSFDYRTLEVFLDAGYPPNATVCMKLADLNMSIDNFCSPNRVAPVPLIVLAFAQKVRFSMLTSTEETTENKTNTIRILFSRGASLDIVVFDRFTALDLILDINRFPCYIPSACISLLGDAMSAKHFVRIFDVDPYRDPRALSDLATYMIDEGKICETDIQAWTLASRRSMVRIDWKSLAGSMLCFLPFSISMCKLVDGFISDNGKIAFASELFRAVVWCLNFSLYQKHMYPVLSSRLMKWCIARAPALLREDFEFYQDDRNTKEKYRTLEWIFMYLWAKTPTGTLCASTMDYLRELFSLYTDKSIRFSLARFEIYPRSMIGKDRGFAQARFLQDIVRHGCSPSCLLETYPQTLTGIFARAISWDLRPDVQFLHCRKSHRDIMRTLWTSAMIARDSESLVCIPMEILSLISSYLLIRTFGFSMFCANSAIVYSRDDQIC